MLLLANVAGAVSMESIGVGSQGPTGGTATFLPIPDDQGRIYVTVKNSAYESWQWLVGAGLPSSTDNTYFSAFDPGQALPIMTKAGTLTPNAAALLASSYVSAGTWACADVDGKAMTPRSVFQKCVVNPAAGSNTANLTTFDNGMLTLYKTKAFAALYALTVNCVCYTKPQ